MKTVLQDRTLWFDGTNEVSPEKIIDFVLLNKHCVVSTTQLTPDVKRYNQLVSHDERISIKLENEPFDFQWNIPVEYKNINLHDYLIDKLDQEFIHRGWTDTSPEAVKRCNRVVTELKAYKQKGLADLLRVLIYVINTLERKQCVWGVGRGSSVSSYVLYLIGVHDIDSVQYEIDFTDFIGN